MLSSKEPALKQPSRTRELGSAGIDCVSRMSVDVDRCGWMWMEGIYVVNRQTKDARLEGCSNKRSVLS